MADVVWPDAVLDQLDQIVAYIELFDPTAAERISRRVFDLGDGLADFPHRGRPVGDGSREMVTVPPYVLRYEVVDDVVTILDIRHGARMPSPKRS
jgi:plasmid stabilization system protein ParE